MKEEEREIAADRFGRLRTLNSKISDADLRRQDHLATTSKKHKEHCDYVLNRLEHQQSMDLEIYEDKYSRTVMKDVNTKKKLKNLEDDNKADYDHNMSKKKEKYEKVNHNKSNKNLQIKKRNQSLSLKDKRIDRQVSLTRLKLGEGMKAIAEIKRLQNSDAKENNQREKMIMQMKHAKYHEDQRRKEENFSQFCNDVRSMRDLSYMSI